MLSVLRKTSGWSIGRTLLAVAVMAIVPALASAAVTDYQFASGTGSATDMSSGTSQLVADGLDDGVSAVTNIGFDFVFDGTTYTQFSVNTNGLMRLGSTVITSAYSNSITTTTNTPMIMPFWDDMHSDLAGSGGVFSKVTGTSPNRVLTVEWRVRKLGGSATNPYYYQVRLYESSNRIEFYYGAMATVTTTSASIGIQNGASNYVSITPGTPATASTTTANNNINNVTTPIPAGTLYTLTPCVRTITLAGDPTQGGTAAMASGDVLLGASSTQRGNSGMFQPFTISQGANACSPRNYTFTITGAAAGDYQIAPASGTLAVGGSVTPTITFTPSAIGRRTATLTVVDDNGLSRLYTLSATGGTRIGFGGNIAQGGTATMASGDTLLAGKAILRLGTQTYQPLTLTNVNGNAAATPASVIYSINDPSGQYTLVGPTTASLAAGQSSTPTIRFSPTGVGLQYAMLTVNADGEVRVYTLAAFSQAPGGTLTVDGVGLRSGVGLFINQTNCVGEVATTKAIQVVNTGFGDFTLDGVNIYEVDTVYTSGIPSYPVRRDAAGRPVASRDYVITASPGVAPIQSNYTKIFPMAVPQGGSTTLYITYVGQEPGKRFARVYLATNGQNFTGVGLDGVTTSGLVTFDLFGRAVGGKLSDISMGGLPKAMTFPTVRVGDSVEQTYVVSNSGNCDLRISQEFMRVAIGDVRDFVLVRRFQNLPLDGASGTYVLAPGARDSFVVRFKPQRGGSRRATLWLKTNDSSITTANVAERGSYYLDLYGVGKAGLDFSDLTLKTAVIGASASSGVVVLENSSTQAIDILSIAFLDDAAGEFGADATNPWPTLFPTTILPGTAMKLGVTMTPTGGPGMRSARLRVVTATNDTFYVKISGEAGTRSIAANPTSMFDNTSVTVGTTMRRTLSITNTGSLPLALQTPTLSGAGAADYTIGKMPRLVLDPGAVEFVEITFAPSAAASLPATLTINSDATGGAVTVALNGTGARTARGGDDPVAAMPGVGAPNVSFEEITSEHAVSGVQGEAAIAGVSLEAAYPNPAREWATITYRLDRGRQVELSLYSERGEKVEVLESGAKPSGEHTMRVNVGSLASGLYYYRLVVDGEAVTGAFAVVK